MIACGFGVDGIVAGGGGGGGYTWRGKIGWGRLIVDRVVKMPLAIW